LAIGPAPTRDASWDWLAPYVKALPPSARKLRRQKGRAKNSKASANDLLAYLIFGGDPEHELFKK
jgi:hypothetical protein